MKMKKKIVSWLLILALCVSSLVINKPVKATTQSDAVSWANAQVGKGLDYDGMYGNQCVDLIKYYYDYFGVANYATGNANAYITNNLPSGWTRVYGNYQPGDIAVWKTNHSCSTCNTGAYGHVGIILSADGTGFNAVNQNFNSQDHCTVNWFYCSALSCAIRPAYTSAQTPAAPQASISFADFSQNTVNDTNAEMYIKVMNPNHLTFTSLGCYLYTQAGTLLHSYTESCTLNTSYVNYNCNVNNDMKYTLTPGTVYKFILFASINGQEYKDEIRTFTTTGAAPASKTPVPASKTSTPAPTSKVTASPKVKATATPRPTSSADTSDYYESQVGKGRITKIKSKKRKVTFRFYASKANYYSVNIKTANGKKKWDLVSFESKYSYRLSPGKYKVRIAGENFDGSTGSWSAWKTFRVR